MGICDVPVISNVCDAVGEATATLISAPFDWLAHATGAAASWLFQGVWALFDTTTLVDVSAPGYLGVYNVVFGVAIFLMLMFFCFQLLTALVRREPGALAHAAVGLAKSVLGSFIALAVVTLLLEVVDQLTIGIIQASGNTLEGMGGKIGVLIAGLAVINIAAPGAGAIITIFLAFLAIAGAALVWFSLLIRKSLILVGIVLAPIALSGMTWEKTKTWFPKWASFVLALILSKLVVVVIFLVAINQMDAPIDLDLASIADPVAGIVLMLVAAFAPYMVYKFISFVGVDMYQMASTEQEAKQAMNRPVPLPTTPSASPQKILEGTSDKSGDGGGSSAPPPKPETPETTSISSSGGDNGGAAAESGASGGGASAGAGAGGGTAAAAGPIAAGIVVAKGAAEAGPKAGNAIGQAAENHADQAEPSEQAPPTSPAPTPPNAGSPAPQSSPTAEDTPPPPREPEVPASPSSSY